MAKRVRRPENLSFNHCSRFINQIIYSTKGYRLGTIHSYKDIEPEKFNQRHRKLKRKKPEFTTSTLNELNMFEPKLKNTCARNKEVMIYKQNGLCFSTIREDGKVVEKRVSKDKDRPNDVCIINTGTRLVIDENNKKVRLMGYKTCPEWIDVDII